MQKPISVWLIRPHDSTKQIDRSALEWECDKDQNTGKYLMKRRHFLKTAASAACAAALPNLNCSPSYKRPNILLIMGDDIGFSDLGCYGSEIETPNLDALARSGQRYTQFYNMAKCNPTRSSLFTGLYLPRAHADNAQSLPQMLRNAGYYTAMSGKEHFDDWVPHHCYAPSCFDRSFSYWAINPYFVPPDRPFPNPFKLDGENVNVQDMPVKQQPFYKTDVVTNYALQFLDEREPDQPFFLYLPYHSAHYPLQARQEDIDKYRGTYQKGWDLIRKERFERQKELGVIAHDCELSPPEDNINKFRGPYRRQIYKYRPWNSLSEQEQDELDLEMAVFAAMVDRMDQNIGRILAKLDEMGERENTLILFFSDNGSCPYDSNQDFNVPPGGPASYRTLCAAWANVGDTPFRFYKQYGHEGGCRTHMIANWPRVIKAGLVQNPAHVVDFYPTFLELARTNYPDQAAAKPTPKLDGKSLVSLFQGGTRENPDIIISGFTDRFRMVRIGDWKIVKVNAGPWQLYNVAKDPTELLDLAKNKPKVKELENCYKDWLKSENI